MKTQSAKAKGRRAVAELREILLQFAPELEAGDIEVKPTSVPGEDLWLSPKAQSFYPFAIEVKNTEKMNIWECLKQTIGHSEGTPKLPLLVFRRNRSELFVSLRLRDFLFLFCSKGNS